MKAPSKTTSIAAIAAIAVTLCVAADRGAAVATANVKRLTAEALIGADQDALRVMCAVEPPAETQFGWMRICESVAGVERRALARAAGVQ